MSLVHYNWHTLQWTQHSRMTVVTYALSAAELAKLFTITPGLVATALMGSIFCDHTLQASVTDHQCSTDQHIMSTLQGGPKKPDCIYTGVTNCQRTVRFFGAPCRCTLTQQVCKSNSIENCTQTKHTHTQKQPCSQQCATLVTDCIHFRSIWGQLQTFS